MPPRRPLLIGAPAVLSSSLSTHPQINPALLRENLRIREEAEHWRRECERTRKAMEAMRLASDIAARGGSTANGEDAAVDAAADSVSVPTGR